MQRRELVSALSLATAGIVAPFTAPAAEPADPALLPGRYDDFRRWLDDARAAALRYLTDYGASDTERFMKFLSLWTCAMPDPAEPPWQAMRGANASLEMATVAPGRPFVVSAFRMGPGCVLPLHCHPGGGGITLCTSGSLAIQHFELCEDQPPFSDTGARAEVRHVQVAQLAPRQATSFTPTLSNLHQFRAGPQGASGVEIAVQWRGSGEFSFLKLPVDVPIGQFLANERLSGEWVGMRLEDAHP